MAKQFWIRSNGRDQGPFSSAQLKQLAAQGQLRAEHEVSADRLRWTSASTIKGLSLPADDLFPPDAEFYPPEEGAFGPPGGMPSETWDSPAPLDDWPLGDAAAPTADLWDELPKGGLSPTPPTIEETTEPPKPLTYGTTVVATKEEPPAPGSSDSMAFDWPMGVGIGATIGVLLLLGGCTLTGVVALAVGDAPFGGILVLAVGLGAVIAAGAVFACSGYGSKLKIELTANGPGRATCSITRQLAFLPVHSEEFLVTSDDTLFKQIQDGGTFILTPTPADIFMILFIMLMCLIGFIPGAIFWVLWWNSRNDAQHCYCDVALTLQAQNRGKFLRLWKQRVRDYRATRFGDPTELEKLMKLFDRYAAPKLVVQEL
jgi:hypothetical protein